MSGESGPGKSKHLLPSFCDCLTMVQQEGTRHNSKHHYMQDIQFGAERAECMERGLLASHPSLCMTSKSVTHRLSSPSPTLSLPFNSAMKSPC